MSFEDATRRMMRLRGELAAIGEIDEALLKEAQETEKRYAFLEEQSADLEKAVADLEAMIVELRGKIHDEFATALKKINEEFGKFFELMFGGGQAKLKLQSEAKKPAAEDGSEEAEEESEPGIEISLALPRRKVTSLEVLSGGEKSLVGIAALFALVSVSPPPFLVLDEIDAALDERNTRRFAEMLKEFAKDTQFIVVTHNRATMEVANVLYGVTVDVDGSSRVVSLKFEAKG
jgi:chromosome segregation protein